MLYYLLSFLILSILLVLLQYNFHLYILYFLLSLFLLHVLYFDLYHFFRLFIPSSLSISPVILSSISFSTFACLTYSLLPFIACPTIPASYTERILTAARITRIITDMIRAISVIPAFAFYFYFFHTYLSFFMEHFSTPLLSAL